MTIVNVSVDKTTLTGDVNTFQGSTVDFLIRVQNIPHLDANGVAHNADGTFIQDIIPAGVTALGWSATYFNGAVGPASGVGNLVTQITTLPAGGWAEYVLATTVSPNAAIGFVRNTAIASLTGNRTCLTQASMTGFVDLMINKKRSNVVISKTGSGSFEKGRTSQFTVTIENVGPNVLNGGRFSDELPDGVYIKNWAASYVGGATGPASGTKLPVAVSLPVGGKIVFTLNSWIEPDACMGAVSNKAKFTFPPDVDHVDGRSCVDAVYDFQILSPQSVGCQVVTGCLTDLCCDETAAIVGYVTVKLFTPDNVPVYEPFSGRQIVGNHSYKFDINANGCWETCALPINSQLISKRTGEPIPSYYEAWVVAGSQSASVVNPTLQTQGHYRFRFSADEPTTLTKNILDIDEINPRRVTCTVPGAC
jgi:uncharacterized repeat protein (TIGR01451 family)